MAIQTEGKVDTLDSNHNTTVLCPKIGILVDGYTDEGNTSGFDLTERNEKIETERGNIYVTITGEINHDQPAIITYHDIGLTYRSCYQTFFNHPSVQQLFLNYSILHIDLPGCQPCEPTIEKKLTMDDLVYYMDEVAKKFNLNRLILFGVGLASSAVINYSLIYPKKVLAMVLISPSNIQMGWREWGYWMYLRGILKGLKLSPYVRNAFLLRYVSLHIRQYNPDLAFTVEYELQRLNSKNIGNNLAALLKPPPDLMKRLKASNIPTLVFAAKYTVYEDSSWNVVQAFKNGMATMSELDDCGALLVHQEVPEKLVQPIELFLKGVNIPCKHVEVE